MKTYSRPFRKMNNQYHGMMDQIPLMLFVIYIAYLAYIGVKGGEKALQAHLFMWWALLILGGIIGLGWIIWRAA